MTWIIDVKETDDGEAYIELNKEILEASGFKEGDSIKWVDNLDGSYTLIRFDMPEYTFVDRYENINLFRSAGIYKHNDNDEYIVDMWSGGNISMSRKISSVTLQYVEDCAENWICAQGEFAK